MVFISAICHGQWYPGPLGPRWYFTSYMSYVLQNYVFFFHIHVSKSAKHSLSFKNDVRFLDIR